MPANRMLPVFGEAMSDAESFSAAEIRVLETLALCEELNDVAPDANWSVDLSNCTRDDRKQPWRLTVHSRTAKKLEERDRSLVKVSIYKRGLWEGYEHKATLTADGRLAVAAIVKARGGGK